MPNFHWARIHFHWNLGVQSHIVENLEIENAYRYEISCVEGYLTSLSRGENHFNQSYSDFKQEEKMPYFFSLFSSCHRKEMSFIRTYATKSLFSPHSMLCIHISKLYSKNHDLGIIIFIRKLLKYLLPSRNFIPKMLIFTGYINVH